MEEIAEALEQVQAEKSFQLRSVLIHGLNIESVESMLKENDFYDKILNRSGRGLKHLYAVIEGGNTKVIYDWLTSLMWQKSGSDNYMNFAVAQEYITQLNRENFAGFNNWRLPTLDEAMSLMEREKKNGDLYIDSVFNDAQSWIWTADKESVSMAWSVGFRTGCCGAGSVINYSYVRAVRS